LVLPCCVSTNRFVCQQQRSEIMQHFLILVTFFFPLRRSFLVPTLSTQLFDFVGVFEGHGSGGEL
jgi:hypothetical protein